ncbi:MAG: universal stress protein [Chloroflexota bacterium]|nr:universal stress protein [Chloroflexota bacterium]
MDSRGDVVLVPVAGTADDERAIDLAILLAKRHRTVISAIHVVAVPQALALENEMSAECGRGEAILSNAEECARRYGWEIEIELLQARSAGAAIVDEAIGRDATLIVMATSIHHRAGQPTVGRTTVPYVLKNAPCEVVVSRRPMDGY